MKFLPKHTYILWNDKQYHLEPMVKKYRVTETKTSNMPFRCRIFTMKSKLKEIFNTFILVKIIDCVFVDAKHQEKSNFAMLTPKIEIKEA